MRNFILGATGKLDLLAWTFVLLFFCGSALLLGGSLHLAFAGAACIIFEMLLISVSIECIIEALKERRGIGTITGFITNGPEAVCLLAGLMAGDILFAASTPLGSNFMNPVLFLAAALVCRQVSPAFATHRLYTVATLLLTGGLAAGFYLIAAQAHIFWLPAAIIISSLLFFLRPGERPPDAQKEGPAVSSSWLLPSILILAGAGYFLDPAVSFAARHSHAPKGVIGFLVLATLSSWPEFKSCVALLGRGKTGAAVLNITVSNITNIWLAAAGLAFHLFVR